MNSKSRIISTDEDPSLRIESSAIINLRGVSTKLNKYIVFTMQTYKKLIETGNCQKIMSLLFGSCVSSFSGVPSFSSHNILVADYTIINLAIDYLIQYSHN